jgi:hypothetical protein
MALAKTILTKFGVNTTYHKLTTITISWHTRECYADVYSYISQELREQEKSPLSTRHYEFSGDGFTFDVNLNISEQIYNKLKEMEEWTDATDC